MDMYLVWGCIPGPRGPGFPMGGDPFLTVLSRPAELPPTEMWAQNQEKCVSLTRSPSVRIILHCLVLQTFVLCNNPGTLYRRQSLCCLPLEPHCPEALPHSNCDYGGGGSLHHPAMGLGCPGARTGLWGQVTPTSASEAESSFLRILVF